MSTLVWKELRLASDLILGALILFAASFPLAFAGVAMQGVRPYPWLSAFAGGCILNQYTMVLTSALLGAVAFVREREEGNTDFLAILPLNRKDRFTAKVVACLSVWLLLWALNAAVFSLIALLADRGLGSLVPYLPRIIGVAALTFTAMGFAAVAGRYIDRVVGTAFSSVAALVLLSYVRLLALDSSSELPFFSPGFIVFLAVLGGTGFLLAYVFSSDCRGSSPSRANAGAITGKGGFRKHRSPNSALYWKELRLLRPALLAGFAILFFPFLAASIAALRTGAAPKPILIASLSCMAFGWLLLPLWAGVALAGEWEAGTHRFTAGLPICPRRATWVKLFTALVPAAATILLSVTAFLWSYNRLPEFVPGSEAILSWDTFHSSPYLGGAVAYAAAMPVTFAVAWYFAARLRRTIIAIILGALTGPVAMALWALTGGPGAYLPAYFSPVSAVGLHVLLLLGIASVLVAAGSCRSLRMGCP